MILPTARSANQSPVTPVLFPESVPASIVHHLVQVPEQPLEIPEFPEPEISFPGGVRGSPPLRGVGGCFPLPFLSKGLPATSVSLLQGHGPPPKLEVVECKPNRIVEILKLGYEAFERTRCLPPHVREAAQMAMQCRTSALGGHVEACPAGHIERIHYNSCGHRFCPRCGYRKQQKWIEQQRTKLLPVRHFHATFTIPHEFNDLWWQNFKQMAEYLFHSAAQALQELLADPERVGVQIGISAALHTWDDQMLRHPHLHCLITGGGLSPEGKWKDSYKPGDKPFLVSVKALMQRFRKLLCTKLKNAIKKDKLKLPKGWGTQQMLNLINKVNRTDWQVFIAKPPEDGGPTAEEILEYQSKTVAGGPMSEIRIERIERTVAEWQEGIQTGQLPQLRYVSEAPLSEGRVQEVSQHEVTFRWGTYDKATGRRVRDKTETIPLQDFIQRLLWHVPPPDFQAIRHYGLYTSSKKAEYQQCRAILPKSPEAERTGTADAAKTADGRIPLNEYMAQRSHCPVCGKELVITRVLPSSVTGKISPRDKKFMQVHTRARRRGG